jgi:regulatory protein
MLTVTRISEQLRRPNRRNVHLDGMFAFGCNVNVVAKFRLREGMTLTADEVRQIELGEVKQECFDRAMASLGSRLHSRAELRRKLMRREYGETVVDAVLADLARLGYVDDDQFARAKATSAARHKHHGRRRAFVELRRSGVTDHVAGRALDGVYAEHDSTAVAKALALKQLARLQKLDPPVARRRLVGMLQRRGFDYDAIKPVVDEVLGRGQDRGR